MNVQRFRTYTGPEDAGATYTTHDLTILPVDRMRAERESSTALAPSLRGANAANLYPNAWVLLWLWCSATRAGITSEKFADWSATVLDFDRLDADGNVIEDKAAADAAEVPQVDPTNGAGATT